MVAPRYRIHGWSWLGVVNFLFFQWFFIRLVGTCETPVLPGKTKMALSFSGWAIPLTGWWTEYRYIGGKEWKN